MSISGAVMPSEDTKILECDQYQKSGNTLSVIYENLEPFIENIDGYKNNSEKLSTAKIGAHIPQGVNVQCLESGN